VVLSADSLRMSLLEIFYICISATSPNCPLTTCGSKQWTAYAYRVDSRIRNCVVLAWYYRLLERQTSLIKAHYFKVVLSFHTELRVETQDVRSKACLPHRILLCRVLKVCSTNSIPFIIPVAISRPSTETYYHHKLSVSCG
jgi:hypothetical protein